MPVATGKILYGYPEGMEFDYAKLAMDIFDEINLARQVPNALISGLTSKLEFFKDNLLELPNYERPFDTYEGTKAVWKFVRCVVQRRDRVLEEAGAAARLGLQQRDREGCRGASSGPQRGRAMLALGEGRVQS